MFVEKCAQSFFETQGSDTKIRPGVSDRKGLKKMMSELSLETQIGVSQMEGEDIYVQNLSSVGVFYHTFCKLAKTFTETLGRQQVVWCGEEKGGVWGRGRPDVGKIINIGHEGLVRQRSLDLTEENGEPAKNLSGGSKGQVDAM